MQCLPNALDQKTILHTQTALFRRSHNLSMLKSSNMLAQALAALMANDVSASQQSRCSFDGTAFLISRPRLVGASLKRPGRGTFISNRFSNPGSRRAQCSAAFSAPLHSTL